MGQCTSKFMGVGNNNQHAVTDLLRDMKEHNCTNIVMENNYDIMFTYKNIIYSTQIAYHYDGDSVTVCIY